MGESEQVFLGEYQHAIDDKGRLTIPVRYRKPLLKGLVITRGLDRNLVIYPLDEWEELVAKIDRLPYSDPKARSLRRLLFAGATSADPDKQGRVNVPSYLLEYGNITKEVVVAGLNAEIELWSPERGQLVRRELESEEPIGHWTGLDL